MNLHDWYKRVDLASRQAAAPRAPMPPSETSSEADVPTQDRSASAASAILLEPSAGFGTASEKKTKASKKQKKAALRRVEGADEPSINAETREQLLSRLLDPILSLEEAAKVLNVCPTTVRRYTNSGALAHLRTQGNQRRFLLSDVLAFLKSQQAGMPGSRASKLNSVARQGRSYSSDAARGTLELDRGS